jgi:hypothetical protein
MINMSYRFLENFCMLNIGNTFCSPNALVRCLNAAVYNPETGEIDIDQYNLLPQSVNSDFIGRRDSVWHDGKKVGYADLRNIDPERANSIWRITAVDADASGCGDSHNISGKSTTWTKFTYHAQRILKSGQPHPNKENLIFSSSGFLSIPDLTLLSL